MKNGKKGGEKRKKIGGKREKKGRGKGGGKGGKREEIRRKKIGEKRKNKGGERLKIDFKEGKRKAKPSFSQFPPVAGPGAAATGAVILGTGMWLEKVEILCGALNIPQKIINKAKGKGPGKIPIKALDVIIRVLMSD